MNLFYKTATVTITYPSLNYILLYNDNNIKN